MIAPSIQKVFHLAHSIKKYQNSDDKNPTYTGYIKWSAPYTFIASRLVGNRPDLTIAQWSFLHILYLSM